MCRLPCLTIVASTRFWFCVWCAVALLNMASIVHADDIGLTIAEFLDSNNDGKISYDEFVHSMAVKAIREMDENKDSFLMSSEIASSVAKGNAQISALNFSKIDTNSDGRISLEELKQALGAHADVETLFKKLDTNGDGFLSNSELEGIHEVPLIRIHFGF